MCIKMCIADCIQLTGGIVTPYIGVSDGMARNIASQESNLWRVIGFDRGIKIGNGIFILLD